ncbi:MAG: rhomboid family intramembrane serine protease [Oculatellaceae cyanobacterium Prado106]|jgi:membrane associated rhomboid family serine protease|nr:rhomboid family intramembrane serine protease [Oculatellaceae cyanobacterium Prado106]
MNTDLLLAELNRFLMNDQSSIEEQLQVLIRLIVFLWAIHGVNWGFAGGGFNWVLGNHPRQLWSLPGIVSCHFLHGVRERVGGRKNNSHIVGNTMAVAVLGGLVVLQGVNLFVVVSIASGLISGLGTWLFGRENSYHVGYSGVIFGYFGFLLVYGFLTGNFVAMGLAILAWLRYGYLLPSILPLRDGLSWEGHLFGFIGGVAIAYLIATLRLMNGIN